MLGLFLALLGSGMSLATPMVTKWVLDSLGASLSLSGPITALVGLLLVGIVILTWQWIMLGALGERVVLEARESMVRRLLRATIPAVTRRQSGELVTRVTSDTVLLREAASSSVIGLINGAIMLVGTLVLMGVLDLVLLGTTVAAVVVVGLLFATLMPAIAKAQERAQEHVGRVGGRLEGALRAIRTIKVSRAEDRTAERIIDDARVSTKYSIRAVRREAIAWTLAWSGIQLAIILILGVGAWRVSLGVLEVSSLIAFLLYAFALMEPITELSQNLTALQAGIAAAERIRSVDDLEQESSVPAAAGLAAAGAPAILELRDVRAAYSADSEPAVKGVDLVIPRRGHVAIVGPSGAGKTTLFSLILRFLQPQEGEILLDGVPYRELTHEQVRARLAYVEQDTPVVPGTIRDNLLLSHPEAGEDELLKVLHDVRLAEMAGNLDQELSPTSVSGGQRQRIALARALLRTPDVLLLDEATAQLDGLTEAAVHDCIADRASKGAVVTIAHRLSTVIDADTIVVLQDGKVRAQGSHAALLETDELYASLVEALSLAEGKSPAAA
ncbi:ATP-binding cassette subfamily B protein [Nonomuraea endophytica]|uniref:ATP-binding cassette subfamily B protein n=1 Tax=Nonomuraea endophytica TaxID=714136 RepID=A0A7W8A166_9ACTN|nr:ATP-binding cassette subfamily B protein [Nonomuraea endophytica]